MGVTSVTLIPGCKTGTKTHRCSPFSAEGVSFCTRFPYRRDFRMRTLIRQRCARQIGI